MPRGGERNIQVVSQSWDVDQIRKAIKEHTAAWWTEIGKMMTSADSGERKFALSEFNKLQAKALPQHPTGDPDNPIALAGVEITIRK